MSLSAVWPSESSPSPFPKGLPVLRHGRTCLREVRAEDASALADLFADPQVSAHLSLLPTTAQAFVDWVHLSHIRRSEGRAACYTVESDGVVSGLFIASRVSASADTAEAGFALAPACWGTGLFPAASTLFIASLFEGWGLAKVTVRTMVRNYRAIGAMRKLGAEVIDDRRHGAESEFVWAIGPRRSPARQAELR
jgi:[ribosomal protein S5]-alanine N-acetyltransferase